MYPDKFDVYGALYMLCTKWHSGQWSKGYAILSRLIIMGYSPSRSVEFGVFESENMQEWYRKFDDRLRLEL